MEEGGFLIPGQFVLLEDISRYIQRHLVFIAVLTLAPSAALEEHRQAWAHRSLTEALLGFPNPNGIKPGSLGWRLKAAARGKGRCSLAAIPHWAGQC